MMKSEMIYQQILNIKKNLVESFLFKIYSYPEFLEVQLIKKLAKEAKNKTILDAGAGSCKYKRYLTNSKYTSQDSCDKDYNTNYTIVDIVSDIYKIPVKSDTYDFVLCTQVLEHLQYPAKALKEFNRILKPKGELWLSVPFSGGEHQIPHDYFRPTQYWLKKYGEENNFKVKKLYPLGGRFTTLATMLKTLLPGLTESPQQHTFITLVQLPFLFPIMFVLYLIDKLDKNTTFPCGYFIVYKKLG